MRGPLIVPDLEREAMDSPFARFRDRVVAGGVVQDTDVNEVIRTPWYWRVLMRLQKFGNWLTEALVYD